MLAIFAAVVMSTVRIAEAQTAVPQSPTLTPGPVATPQPAATATPPIDKISEFDRRLQKLEDPSKGILVESLDKIAQMAWPIIIFIVVFIYRAPLRTFLTGLASRADRATIKIGGFEMSEVELDDIIVEREILKMGIHIATVDEDYNAEELRFLEGRAAAMTGKLDKLTADARLKVLQEAINMAAADGIIKVEEFIAIKERAAQFKVLESDIDKMIIEMCLSGKVKPPDLLKDKCEQRRKELARSHA
jgi:hypothetical protein